MNPSDIKNNKVHVDTKMVGGKKVPLAEIVKRFKQEVRTQSMPSKSFMLFLQLNYKLSILENV